MRSFLKRSWNAVICESREKSCFPEEWNEELRETMGKIMGRMPAASVKYNSKNLHFRRISYYEDENAKTEKLDPLKDTIVINKFNELKERLNIKHSNF